MSYDIYLGIHTGKQMHDVIFFLLYSLSFNLLGMKISFKTNKPTGRYKSFYHDHHQIKVNGFVTGEINSNDFKREFEIRLMVIKNDKYDDGNPNCKWMWITLKYKFQSLQECKDFIKANLGGITTNHDIQLFLFNDKP